MKKFLIIAYLSLGMMACSSDDNKVPIQDGEIPKEPDLHCGCGENQDFSNQDFIGVLLKRISQPSTGGDGGEVTFPEGTYIIDVDSELEGLEFTLFVCNDSIVNQNKVFSLMEEGEKIKIKFKGDIKELCDEEAIIGQANYGYAHIKLDEIAAL